MTKPPIRLLYVDDDEALARLVQKTLARRGFAVTHAATVELALAAIEADAADVVACDHYLAASTGLELLQRMPAVTDKTPPVVYVTGSTEMNVAVAALKAGATDFVVKSVGDDFLVLLASALEHAVEKAELKAAKEAAEQEVRAARDRAELLLAEVNHRVANSLALVASLVSLQAKEVSDQVAKDMLAETRTRIYAVSQVHQRLYSAGDFRVVALDEYLGGLLDNLRTAMRADGHRASLAYELSPLTLPTDASINLGIILSEWVTNAFKYAYPGQPGEIRVRLAPLAGEKAELAVEDDGVGHDPQMPARGTGLGSRIVKAMSAAIKAEASYVDRHPGTAARLVFAARAQPDI